MRTLYFDCFSGISGDMTVGALIDIGGNIKHLEQELNKLNLDKEYNLKYNKTIKNGITCTKFDVLLRDNKELGNKSHRTYKDIVKMVNESELKPEVKDIAFKLFEKIGTAEGIVHGIHLNDVHFHEVGAIDSIVDIVGTAILINQLQIDKIKSSPVPVGNGTINIEHGNYPVPAPATLKILQNIPLLESQLQTELTTPTGASIISTMVDDFGPLPSMKVTSIGYGAGEKNFSDHPNVLRLIIGENYENDYPAVT